MRFPKTIQFDASDGNVFERAAAVEECAVTGTFMFANAPLEELSRKERLAFASGFLGTASFGWSTFVIVSEIDESAYERVVDSLAGYLVLQFGAPDHDAAEAVAREEASYAAGLCEHPLHTILSLNREIGEDGIIERFSVIERPREPQGAALWKVDDGGT